MELVVYRIFDIIVDPKGSSNQLYSCGWSKRSLLTDFKDFKNIESKEKYSTCYSSTKNI